MQTTDIIHRLGFVTLRVEDVDVSVRFWTEVCHLQVSERRGERVYLTGGSDHHWICLEPQEPGGVGFRLGFEVATGALDEVASRLDARGVPWKPSGALAESRLCGGLTFVDPDGVEIEIFTEMVRQPPVPLTTDIGIDTILHAVWSVTDPEVTAAFYGDVLGFRLSDWIERLVAFMRVGNGYHHSAAVMRTPNPGVLDHVCFLAPSLDDVMRIRNKAVAHGTELRFDLLKHTASGSMSVYLEDPTSNIAVEFCTEHGKLDTDARPRTLPAAPTTANMWAAL